MIVKNPASDFFLLYIISSIISRVLCVSHCQDGFCLLFNKVVEIPQKRLANHVISTHTPSQHLSCEELCALNCKCLSVNYKENGAECQLNSEDHLTAEQSLVPDTNYIYVALTFSHKTCSSNVCENDCCLISPCQNGGTCVEVCNHPKYRFNCTCTPGFTGHFCQHKDASSCSGLQCSSNTETSVAVAVSPTTLQTSSVDFTADQSSSLEVVTGVTTNQRSSKATTAVTSTPASVEISPSTMHVTPVDVTPIQSSSSLMVASSSAIFTLPPPINDGVARSCYELYKKGTTTDGSYQITSGTQKLNVFCHMTEPTGCTGKGWTLIMKINGNMQNFKYGDSKWRDQNEYQPQNGDNIDNDQETKLSTYWTLGFTKLCLGIKYNSVLNWIMVEYTATSLYSVIHDNVYRPTTVTARNWLSLISNSGIQTGCTKEGFNVNGGSTYAGVRIGVVGDREADCSSPDSRLGFGGRGTSCNQNVNTCGNEHNCGTRKSFKAQPGIIMAMRDDY